MDRLTAKFVRIVLILTVVGSGYGNVVCYGSDGHITVEQAFHTHCEHSRDYRQQGDHNRHEDVQACLSNDCLPCVDVVVSADLAPVRSQHSSVYVLTSLNLVAGNSLDFARSDVDGGFAHLPSFFKPLKTIILLT